MELSLIDRANRVLIGNYARLPVAMVRGEGARLWDSTGREYIDFFAGFGGAVIGHAHPALVSAVVDQARQLWHVGNTFHTEPQVELAERLNRLAFVGKAFFCHSGLEANEAAVKLARLRGSTASPRRWKVVSFHRSFHGRSLAMIAATGNPAVKAGFEPAVPGFTQVNLGDLGDLSAAADNETAAVIVEPIQGEGGIHPLPLDFAIELRKLCDQRNITLIFDEVWTGCGRTGRWFGHQHFVDPAGAVVQPDILTLGKAIGGGLPVGVMFAKPALADLLTPGKHGCTIGGNPICMAAARTVLDVIERENLVSRAAELGEHAIRRLRDETRGGGRVAAVRGRGLFLGVELAAPPSQFVERALARGLVTNLTGQRIIRIAPPINIDRPTLDRGLDLLIQTIQE
ncbi:MAG: acetylornithine/succinylornithine family transaminase [Phycisphaerales bacterium]|nr:acetylornithine/succinylornithine family transaminase [Phycisphaerales bacterium]